MLTFAGGRVFINNEFKTRNVIIDNNKILQISRTATRGRVIKLSEDFLIIPAFIDLHTHLRQPASKKYKANIRTETNAALAGGYQMVCAMANTHPPIDNVHKLWVQQKINRKSAAVKVQSFAAVTINQNGQEVVDIPGLRQFVFGFSDDGRGLGDLKVLEDIFKKLNTRNNILSMHLQDMASSKDCVVLQDEKAQTFNLRGMTNKMESNQLAEHLKLLTKYSNVRYHAAHVSTLESVNLIREYKQKVFNLTAEVTPHHLLLECDNFAENSGQYKVNPPLRSHADRFALIKALKEGIIDIIATDHAPHPQVYKTATLEKAKPGFIGLDIMFPLLYTYLIKTNMLDINTVIHATSINPAELFKFGSVVVEENNIANFTIIDTKNYYRVNRRNIRSAHTNTPFYNWNLTGWPVYSVLNGIVRKIKRW